MFICFRLWGEKNTPKAEKEEISLAMSNMLNEGLELLAIKYNLSIKVLVEVISEYEQLTTGYSFTNVVYGINKSDNNKGEKETISKTQIVNIQTAVETVSNKYQIPKDKFANILIDKKILEEAESKK